MLVNVLVARNLSQVANFVTQLRDVCAVKMVGTLKVVDAIDVLMLSVVKIVRMIQGVFHARMVIILTKGNVYYVSNNWLGVSNVPTKQLV
jgi:hypothetical protein